MDNQTTHPKQKQKKKKRNHKDDDEDSKQTTSFSIPLLLKRYCTMPGGTLPRSRFAPRRI